MLRYPAILPPLLIRLVQARTLKFLKECLKTITLLAFLTVQRMQTLYLLKVDDFSFTQDYVQITVSSALKTSRPNHHIEPIIFKKYDANKRLCVFRHIRSYLNRTRVVRGAETQFFISYLKPHAKVTRQTLSRWIKHVLCRSGIDISVFCPHSTRASSASKARIFVPIEKILKAGAWSGESSFQKHYNLPSISVPVQDALLSGSQALTHV